jgi:hypothetical protein
VYNEPELLHPLKSYWGSPTTNKTHNEICKYDIIDIQILKLRFFSLDKHIMVGDTLCMFMQL